MVSSPASPLPPHERKCAAGDGNVCRSGSWKAGTVLASALGLSAIATCSSKLQQQTRDVAVPDAPIRGWPGANDTQRDPLRHFASRGLSLSWHRSSASAESRRRKRSAQQPSHMDSQERRRADLETGLTDSRRDSNAIEHLAAAAAASCRKRRRRWPVAILINFSGPHGPPLLEKGTKRALKWSRLSLKTPPDYWVHRLPKLRIAAPDHLRHISKCEEQTERLQARVDVAVRAHPCTSSTLVDLLRRAHTVRTSGSPPATAQSGTARRLR
jgi:hypothetical protein